MTYLDENGNILPVLTKVDVKCHVVHRLKQEYPVLLIKHLFLLVKALILVQFKVILAARAVVSYKHVEITLHP